MALSAITVLRDIILTTVRNTAQGQWKVLVIDEATKKLMDTVVKEDDVLEEHVTNIERIEDRRLPHPEMDAVYLLSPQPHIVDCLMADFERRRYRRSYLIWTSLLHPELRTRLDKSAMARELIAQFRVLNVDFFPRESHLITFRDPWSFPILFHPACSNLVRKHMDELAQKIVSICVSLGEYPTIRYHRPRNPVHEASVLCSHLARFVQDELDQYTKFHEDFPPPSPRPRGSLIITDRSMDLFAPVLHEFTYQAMVHDLLPVKEGDKVFYRTVVNQGDANEEEKDMEIGERDKIWVENRHLHMKDLLEKLVGDFNKFRAENPQFAESSQNANSINNIKDMLAGLPQFQEGKEAYSLHLSMAQECMNTFQKCRLADIASVEQSLATGLDEDYRKPKNLADQVVRLLDDEDVSFPDRLRLIIEYLLYRDGLLATDIQNLLAHAQLPAQDGEVIHNLNLLGAHVTRRLKDTRHASQPLFSKKQQPSPEAEESGLSRYDPAVKSMLEEHVRGTLDQTVFPFTKPHLDAAEGLMGQEHVSQASLRSAKPTWARTRPSSVEPRQRVIVFIAGGATYSESRACYEISRTSNKDVFLATTHMLTPSLFLRQVADLSADKRRLGIPAEQPKPKAPAHLFEKEPQAAPQPSSQQSPNHSQNQEPPVAGMSAMILGPSGGGVIGPSNGTAKAHPLPVPPVPADSPGSSKLLKRDKDRDTQKKKKHHFFGSKKG
ncbi:sec1 family superfamily [Lasallia pustulata]|uniref:Sec1 family superfamily n=1 Tax=Lasallia pustulata TaxID=136370 RepID=A0A1W5D8I3_9LECA|nr:sec1 family superfamily [Lasallia pustulata]